VGATGTRTVKIKFAGDTAGLTDAASKGGKSLGGFGDVAEKIAGKAGAAFGNIAKKAAAIATVGAIIASSITSADLPGKLQAQLGSTPQVAAELGKEAGAIYAQNFGGSLADVSASVRQVSQNVGSIGTLGKAAFEDANKAALTLADTFEVDVSESTNAVGHLLKTQLVKDAQTGFDLVTVAFQKIPNAADDAIDTLTEYAVQFKQLGLTGPQSLGLIAQGMAAGARNTDLIADALKEFNIRAVDGSKSTADGFGRLGLSASKMAADIAAGGPRASAALDTVLDRLRGVKNPMQQAQVAVELFGTKAEDLQSSLFALDPSKATSALGDFQGAAKRAGDAISSGPSAQIEQAKRAFLGWATNMLGGVVIPMITKLVGVLSFVFGPALTAVTGWLRDNWNWLQVVAIAIGAMVAPMLLAKAGMAAWNLVVGLATKAQAAFNLVMNANPFMLIIGLVAALVAAFVVLWNKSAAFRDFFIGMWHGIQTGVSAAVGLVKSSWDGLVDWFSKIPDRIGRALASLASVISGVFKGALNAVIDAINWALDHSINWVISKANGILAGVGAPQVPTVPHVPRLARGGLLTRGGLAMVGERGREIAALPTGTAVVSHRDTEALMGGGGGTEVHVYIDGQEFRGMVRTEIAERDRGIRRAVMAGAGAAR
jgi:phage-related minor tail protein